MSIREDLEHARRESINTEIETLGARIVGLELKLKKVSRMVLIMASMAGDDLLEKCKQKTYREFMDLLAYLND